MPRYCNVDQLMSHVNCRRYLKNRTCEGCDFFDQGDTWCDGVIYGTQIMNMRTSNVIEVPCMVGDSVYQVVYPTTANSESVKHQYPIIQEHVVSAISINSRGFRVETTYVSQYGYDSNAWFYWDDGYLMRTREEAEQKANKWIEKNCMEKLNAKEKENDM